MAKHDPRYSARAMAQAHRSRRTAAKPPAVDYASEERIEWRERLVREDDNYYIAANGSGVVYLEKRLVGYDGESFWVPKSLAKRKGLTD